MCVYVYVYVGVYLGVCPDGGVAEITHEHKDRKSKRGRVDREGMEKGENFVIVRLVLCI